MKTAYTTLLFSLISLFGFSQTEWASEGATWHYNYSNFSVEGYVLIEKVGDTLIDNINCDILQRESHTYNFISEEYSSGISGYEFTYEEDSVVYLYQDGEFHTLYDFGAEAGDSWMVPGGENCAEEQIVVDSIEWVEISGLELKKLHIHSTGDNQFLGEEIIERLGSMFYMFPTPACITDSNSGGPFRCYSDDTGFTHMIDQDVACDFIVGVENLPLENPEVRLYPNPASDILNIVTPMSVFDNTRFTIYNSFGEKVKTGTLSTSQKRLDISDLSSGAYFLKFESGSDVRLKKFVVH